MRREGFTKSHLFCLKGIWLWQHILRLTLCFRLLQAFILETRPSWFADAAFTADLWGQNLLNTPGTWSSARSAVTWSRVCISNNLRVTRAGKAPVWPRLCAAVVSRLSSVVLISPRVSVLLSWSTGTGQLVIFLILEQMRIVKVHVCIITILYYSIRSQAVDYYIIFHDDVDQSLEIKPYIQEIFFTLRILRWIVFCLSFVFIKSTQD